MDSAHEPDESDGVEIEIDLEQAYSIRSVADMLARPLPPECAADGLRSRLAEACAALALEDDSRQGRRVVATRDIFAGELLFTEPAVAWWLAPPSGLGGVAAMANEDGRLLATLPSYFGLRLLRDTLSFARGIEAEPGYALLTQLTSGDRVEGNFGPAAFSAPLIPPGIDPTPENSIPLRSQLLSSIAQCNAFQVPLPEEDSAWKRALLWPLIGRVRDAADRDALFDDPDPLSTVSAFFVLAAQLNHSCDPAAVIECLWEQGASAPCASITALRDIAAGEEVTHAYTSGVGLTPADRRKALLVTYGFLCSCKKCSAEIDGVGTGTDELTAAGHLPLGAGACGRAAFFAGGGTYPRPCTASDE
jgi:hypothetical protein